MIQIYPTDVKSPLPQKARSIHGQSPLKKSLIVIHSLWFRV